MQGFNEAAGIHRRKLDQQVRVADLGVASMRPPEFTGGNGWGRTEYRRSPQTASMRPPEFTGGNEHSTRRKQVRESVASMRPPEFTGGNYCEGDTTHQKADTLQ